MAQLTICQHWFRWWFGANQAIGHHLIQLWPGRVTCIYIARPPKCPKRILCARWENTLLNVPFSVSKYAFYNVKNCNLFQYHFGITFSGTNIALCRVTIKSSNRLLWIIFFIKCILLMSDAFLINLDPGVVVIWNIDFHVSECLFHWGRVTHICVSDLTSIGSDNGLSPGRRQAIIKINAGILLIRPLGTNFSEFLVEILIFSFKKMRLKVSSAKRRPFCLGLNELWGHQYGKLHATYIWPHTPIIPSCWPPIYGSYQTHVLTSTYCRIKHSHYD